MEWEEKIFIGNIKSFNTLFGYETTLKEDQEYNYTLIDQLNYVYEKYAAQGYEMVPVKIDYLAERSIEDDVADESS